MRIRTICPLILTLVGFSAGQVCNTATTLRPGQFSIGIAPIIYPHGGDADLFLNAGVGIARSMDLSLKAIVNGHTNYFGGDFEFVVVSGFPTISLAAGMHSRDNLGIDGTFNLTLPIRRVVSLYGGVDADIEFRHDETGFPLWGFAGFQVMARRHFGLFMEIDLGINDGAPDMLDLGMQVFF
jgi:hypothetical protein